MRIFLAVELPEKIKDFLKRKQQDLRRSGIKAKWVPRSQLHSTLVFFRVLDFEQVSRLKPIIKTSLKSLNFKKPPLLKLETLKLFPSNNRPRLVVITFREQNELLDQAVFRIRQELDKHGYKYDQKPWHGHITLARIKPLPIWQSNKTRLITNRCFLKRRPEFTANSILVIKSHLSREGPTYETIDKVGFENKD